MMNDDALRDALRGLADRAVADPATLTAVRRAGHRIHRRHQAYAATGVAAVLAGTPITVHAVTSSGGSSGHVQVVDPASTHHRRTPHATPTPSPSVPTATTTATPTRHGAATATPTPSPSPPS